MERLHTSDQPSDSREPSRLQTAKEIGSLTSKTAAAIFAILTFLYGTEPQLTGTGFQQRTKRPDFTYGEYLSASIQQNGDTVRTKVMTTIAYPGAKLGREINNLLATKDKAS